MKEIIKYLLKFFFTLTFFVFLYGMLKFPDVPPETCYENKYCGKYGKFYTVENFEAYNRWQYSNLVLFPTTFLLLFINKRNKENEEDQ